jgi:sterol desaturase/sphingolipid hydroxylase (fatty acid hydroxylase superfamily)
MFRVLLTHLCIYWLACCYYLVCDYRLCHQGVLEWNKHKTGPYNPDRLWATWRSSAWTSVINQTIMLVFVAVFGRPLDQNGLSMVDILVRTPAAVVGYDVLFYTAHRLLHTRLFYTFHKAHHQEPSVAVAADSAHSSFVEYCTHGATIISIYTVIGGAQGVWILITALFALSSCQSHAGYAKSRLHQLHHTKQHVNFGAGLYLMDRAFRTFKKWHNQ